MPQIVVTQQPNITTGDPSNRIAFTATIGYSGSAPSQPEIKAAIVSRDRALTIIPAVVCAVSSFVVAPTSSTVTIAGKVSFSATETRNLLTIPADLSSPLIKAVSKVPDDATGYATALLEIQIGSPFFETWHGIITIGKGLIA